MREVPMKNYLERLKSEKAKPVVGLKDLSRLAATEGIVLLKNDNHVLPLIDQTISVFGRIQTDYYKSGTGSGGLVNVDRVTSIIDAFLENPYVKVNDELLHQYRVWQQEHPFNAGSGFWASEPWSQVEMPLTEEMVNDARKVSDVAVVVIGRTAGEDRDNSETEGSYRLSSGEEDMLKKVTDVFESVIVLLNTGNVMDMSFMDRYPVQAVLYVWHGGQEGGRAAVDVLTGLVAPSGKLPDTITYHIDDYPSTKTFGGHDESIYDEDIYVGYRYFSTFNEKAVRYPFGYGLSYTQFSYQVVHVETKPHLNMTVKVKNTGTFPGKEVVQVYVSQPQGLLGKPKKVLVAFEKTGVLKPGEAEVLSFHLDPYDFASYDEVGLTGHASSYVLEKGTYTIQFSTDVTRVFHTVDYEVKETIMLETLEEVLRPVKAFQRLKPVEMDGVMVPSYEDVPLRSVNLKEKIDSFLPKTLKAKGKNITLKDVFEEKATVEDLVSEMSLEALAEIVRGEGMSSPKVTPGTASAFGGTTDSLEALGLPVLCCADGPSGIRMDSGLQATSMPNGTLLASTFNTKLVEALYYGVGLEMVGYNVDILLGPGMNIHRHPLCGRNFEYFSEDPMLTGLMGAAVVNGLQSAGVTGTIKHIALNNQEYRRFDADSIASERAIREIYLKGFEIAVKKAKARAIMTSYNPINGIWAAGNFDLIARVIRHEWQFKGIVMTDWWAKMNDDQDEGSRTNIKSMIKAQGDLYMVVVDAKGNSLGDNFMQAIEENKMTKGEAQEVAKNIISFILQSSRYQHMMGQKVEQKPNLFPLPVLKKVFVNGIELESFDERKTHYELETYDHFNLTFELEANTSYHVKRNAHTTTVSLINHQAQNQYIFTNRKRHIHRESFQLEDIHTDHPLAISDVAWGKTGLNLIEPTWHNRFIEFKDGYVSMMKNGLISFAIEIKTYGKYIVELSIASDASELSQLPFSILAEDVVLSTLTTKGTGGKWFDIASQVVLTEGIKRLTFKAHASGLNIKRIELIKHQ
jgi:beta-glucosidase